MSRDVRGTLSRVTDVAFYTNSFLQNPQVKSIVALCKNHSISIVPFGAGTSLEGHILSSPSGVTLSLEKMDSILSVNPEDLTCTVQPGVHRLALNESLGREGLFFPVDPGICLYKPHISTHTLTQPPSPPHTQGQTPP